MKNLVKEYLEGQKGEGIILWHKKPHKKGSGELACVRGIEEKCREIINCPDCYTNKNGSYCLKDGLTNRGFLASEPKHKKFLEEGKPGVYFSIKQAMQNQ